jgi:hypothetical protein
MTPDHPRAPRLLHIGQYPDESDADYDRRIDREARELMRRERNEMDAWEYVRDWWRDMQIHAEASCDREWAAERQNRRLDDDD